jgi:hypothetical protein
LTDQPIVAEIHRFSKKKPANRFIVLDI